MKNSVITTELIRLGFKLTHQGGGCSNFVYTMPNGLTLTASDAESPCEPEDDHPVVLAITCDEHSETLAIQKYETGRALAKVLRMSVLPQLKTLPRFVITVGSYAESFPDIPADCPLGIWDRQERCAVLWIESKYEQLICLEKKPETPVTSFCEWLNSLSNEDLASEGLPITRK